MDAPGFLHSFDKNMPIMYISTIGPIWAKEFLQVEVKNVDADLFCLHFESGQSIKCYRGSR
jgi:hypothetical protein